MNDFDLALPVFITIAGLFGLCIGSFLNVVIHRLPKMMEQDWQREAAELRGEQAPAFEPISLSRPASRCPHCGTRIAAWQNLPLLSYLILGGRCGHCKARISPRYPIVELAGGLLAGACAWQFGPNWTALAAMVFCWSLLALTFIDLDTQLLPDSITQPLLWLGLLLNLRPFFVDLPTAVIGATLGYLSLWSVFWAFKLLTGKEGMGYGDFKLLAAIGAWLGWKLLPFVILASSAIGAIIGIGLMLFARHGRETPIPFGPYLAGAGIAALFWGETLTNTYLAQF
ncbi:MAG: A24 family peptidase [Betaproteobacteria bacterium]|nr:A24 family peptidase [Betaproteobacteria bacterium]